MAYYGRTDIGRERSTNEDAFLILEHAPFHVFGVADGMGGHAAGEVASSLAFLCLRAFIESNLHSLQSMDPTPENFATFITNMISEANYTIWQSSRDNPDQQGMGTTITVLVLFENQYFIGHVGDSRAYLVRRDDILQITRDHSLVGEMVESGSLDKTDAAKHPQRNVLTRALGTNTHVEMDFYHGNFQRGDFFILCTDGLTAFVTEGEMVRVCQDGTSEKDIANTLVSMANTKGGRDNITVVVVQDLQQQPTK